MLVSGVPRFFLVLLKIEMNINDILLSNQLNKSVPFTIYSEFDASE